MDFEVSIGAGGPDGYPVSALAPDGGEASAVMRLPEVALNVLGARIPDAVMISPSAVQRPSATGEQPVRELGTLLYYALFTGEVRGLLIASQRTARGEGELRLVLRVEPPELAALPWEFLFDPADGDYLCVSVPVIRRLRVLRPVSPLPVEPPLRVLAMAIGPLDGGDLAIGEERDRLRAALSPLEQAGLVELAWAEGQSWRALRDSVADGGPWHILHFSGHGVFDPEAGEGALVLVDGDGSAYHLPASDLTMLLKSHESLRLVVLNACDTGRAGALGPFSSIAGSLIRGGVPAVVAMQYAISDQAAITLSQAFYEALAEQRPVDVAVTRARQAVRLDFQGSLEWGTPVLYMRSPDGRLFDFPRPPANVPPRRPAPAPTPAPAPSDGEDLERSYNEALDAYYSERWDEAISLFRSIADLDGGYRDVRGKLEQAEREQRAGTAYAAAREAADAGAWEDAIGEFEAVFSVDPGYRDVRSRLADARRRRDVSWLTAEARRLHADGKWKQVIAVGEKLAAIGPDFADPDGLVTEALHEVNTRARADDRAVRYNQALRQLDAGNWSGALRALEEIGAENPGYRETQRIADRARRHLREANGLVEEPLRLQTLHLEKNLAGFQQAEFSRDGRFIALLSYNQALVFDVAKGTERFRIGLVGPRGRMALNADGSRIATGDKEALRIWDTVTRREVIALKKRFVNDLRWSALTFNSTDNQLASAQTQPKSETQVWDPVSGQPRLRIGYAVDAAAFSADGRRLATSDSDGTMVRDTADGSQLLELSHSGTKLAFSPDGRLLAAAAPGKKVQIWHATSGRQVQVVAGPGPAHLLAFGPDGTWLVTADTIGPPKQSTSTLRVWDAATGARLLEAPLPGPGTWSAVSGDGSLACTTSGNTLQIWKLRESAGE